MLPSLNRVFFKDYNTESKTKRDVVFKIMTSEMKFRILF